jgi:hypothetical protein
MIAALKNTDLIIRISGVWISPIKDRPKSHYDLFFNKDGEFLFDLIIEQKLDKDFHKQGLALFDDVDSHLILDHNLKCKIENIEFTETLQLTFSNELESLIFRRPLVTISMNETWHPNKNS